MRSLVGTALASFALVGTSAFAATVNNRVLNEDYAPITDRTAIGHIAPSAGSSTHEASEAGDADLKKSDVLVGAHLRAKASDDSADSEWMDDDGEAESGDGGNESADSSSASSMTDDSANDSSDTSDVTAEESDDSVTPDETDD